ncbi:dTMP kinase [Treponema parvum]|uniref:dTMP kinase n=1 Tax=Treponema parvum TaxID=138851 RepID=UPI001AEC2E58|nr:dTMP kinase [Treponema parvum]QTQ15927.1 dTMP kinase [Treponema parvum]
MVLKNFIALEGIDGSGTSTQLKILSERPEREKFFITAEPTSSPTGVFLRRVLKGELTVEPRTAAFLFAADRNEHINGAKGIREQIAQGKIAISDRYTFSSLAYQSVSCGWELPYKLNEDFPLPQILFFFEIPPDVALKRIKNRNFTEIYEKREYLEKTAAAYKKTVSFYEKKGECGKNGRMKIVRLNAEDSVEKTAEIIWSYMEDLPIFKE